MSENQLVLSKSDPYERDDSQIQEPPKGWIPSLRFLGPGMVTSAAVVGSGELLTATALGAKVGFTLLWIILISTLVKVGVQVEVARWSISEGKASVTGYNAVPPVLFGRGWISWVGLLNFVQCFIGQGGVVSAGAFCFSMALPVIGEPLSASSLAFWVIVLIGAAIGIHITNRYDLVERICTLLVVLVSVSAVALVIGLLFTPFAWTLADIKEGLSFKVTAGAMGLAIAAFGWTGVGADEITKYSYWCVEKGYAAWTGPNDGSEAWVKRARGWIAVMKKDAIVSWCIYTTCTVAFYVLGAAVLHPQGLMPEGTEVIATLSRIFTDTMGEGVEVFFLVGAGITLFKTTLANIPGFARQMTNTLSVFGAFTWEDSKARNKWVRIFMVILPIAWGAFALAIKAPLAMVVFAGIVNSIWLMVVVIAVTYLGLKQTDRRIRDGWLFNIYFAISGIAVFAVGVITLLDQF
jgi:Mn2+/Fe2+ NRAMP family transporter